MQFLIADSFTESLSRLTGDEQKAVKTTAFDLQISPASPGMSFHKLDRAKDKNFWSVRVNADVRLIVHKTEASLLLCYVDHHDAAYHWAERRKLQTHPRTGAAQLVEIREVVQTIAVPRYVEETPKRRPAANLAHEPLLAHLSDEELLSYGIPPEWLADAKSADTDSLLALVGHLPAEAAEAMLQLATGETPRKTVVAGVNSSPFSHPDAQRRFRIVANVEELQQALEFPWEKWTIFLHPDQRQLVEREYNGPARVAGSAGTGKTIVALHRAVWLARNNPEARVLLTTFSEPLAHALKTRLNRLVGSTPRLAERIDVEALPAVGRRLYRASKGTANVIERSTLTGLIRAAAGKVGGHKFTMHFLIAEWDEIVDAWQLADWEAYRAVPRLGRKTRLSETQREILWKIYQLVQDDLASRNLATEAGVFTSLATSLKNASRSPYDFAVVDEAQDTTAAQVRFLASLAGQRDDGLFFAGDLGQRIFQQPFSWKSLGVDVRGRSRTLRVNYRTSHQIRMQADKLLGPELSDVDGNKEERKNTISVFNGPPPEIRILQDDAEEIRSVGDWLRNRIQSGVRSHEIGIFVRSDAELDQAREAVKHAGLTCVILDDHVDTESGKVSISTMHRAKGLEFRSVAVMACDDEVIPSQGRIEAVGDDADLQEVYETERQLLYVACTRARDHLLVTGIKPGSEFLDDLKA